jgi:hypothetical protein
MISTVDLARDADVSFRQIDYWIRNGALPAEWAPGPQRAGGRRVVDARYVPVLRLFGKMGRALAGRSRNGVDSTLIPLLFEHYEEGILMLDGFTIEWEVEDD